MIPHAASIANTGIGIKNLADGLARAQCLAAGGQGIGCDLMHFDMTRQGIADRNGAHHCRVIMAIGPSPFECDLIGVGNMFAAGEIAAQKCIATRTNDKFIARVIPATGKYRTLHGSKNVAFECTGMDG